MKHRRDTLEARTQRFLDQAICKFGDKFNYSKVKYVRNSAPVSIICPSHEEFTQRPQNHLDSKEGCFTCGKEQGGRRHRMTIPEFVNRAKEHHGNSYSYDKVQYIDAFTPVVIVCPTHGDFRQQPNDHIYHGNGCKQCGYETRLSKGERRIAECLTYHKIDYITQHSFEELKALDGVNYLRYDFFIPCHKLLIEFDGPHHTKPTQYSGTTLEKALHTHERTKLYDMKKDEFAKNQGLQLLRIPYHDLKNIEVIITLVLRHSV